MATRKHRKINAKGETLVEALVSLTILTLSILCMTYMISFSGKLNSRAQSRNKDIYKFSSNIEQNTDLEDVGTGKITIKINKLTYSKFVDVKKSGELFILRPKKETP